MKRPSIPQELSREEFEKVRYILESVRKTTRPKIYDTYDVFCAVLFIVRSSNPWRSLPGSFPPWRSVHQHFLQWTSAGEPKTCLEEALDELGLHEASSAVRVHIEARRRAQL